MPEQREPYHAGTVERFQVCAADFMDEEGQPCFDLVQQEAFFTFASSLNAALEGGYMTRAGAMLVLDLLLDLLRSGRREVRGYEDYYEAIARQRRRLKEEQ